MRRGAPIVLLCAASLLGPGLGAQHRRPPFVIPPRASAVSPSPDTLGGARAHGSAMFDASSLARLERQDVSGRRSPWWAPLASAVVPGSGQLVMRERRGIPFLAAEVFLLIQYATVREDAREFRREYQRLAQVARSFFTEEFPAGDFEYYERMEQFVESGAYDLDPNAAFAPETDTATFNGFTWQIARRTFWENPDVPPPSTSDAYVRAIEFYEERAVREEFRWSWQNAQLEQDLFRQTIQRSNGAFRRTSQYLGVLIANHALSAIDAFVMLRLSREPGPAGEYRITGRVPWAPLGRGERTGSRE